jgi:hypothetical protein
MFKEKNLEICLNLVFESMNNNKMQAGKTWKVQHKLHTTFQINMNQ